MTSTLFFLRTGLEELGVQAYADRAQDGSDQGSVQQDGRSIDWAIVASASHHEIALVKGKKLQDKRDAIREKDLKREADRAMRVRKR